MIEKVCILRLLAAIIFAGFCFLCVEAQTTLQVSVSTGADGPSCGTTGSPCASLQGALTVLGSNPGSINVAAGTYAGANNTNLNLVVSTVAIFGVGVVTFSGGGTMQGWTLSGNGVVIENVIFSEFSTSGAWARLRNFGLHFAVLMYVPRKWWSCCGHEWDAYLFELRVRQQQRFRKYVQLSLGLISPAFTLQCVIIGYPNGYGGAVHVNGGTPNFSNCTFTSNTAGAFVLFCVDV
jgi:hypothetical protein